MSQADEFSSNLVRLGYVTFREACTIVGQGAKCQEKGQSIANQRKFITAMMLLGEFAHLY